MKTEREILEIAFQMFLEKGFSEVSTNEIIRKAGLTKGGFYYSFRSREELDRKVIDHYLKPFSMFAVCDMKKCWDKRHEHSTEWLLWNGFFQPLCFENYEKWVGREIPFSKFYFLLHEGMKKFPELIEANRTFAAERKEYLRAILERGQERGEILKTINLENYITMILAMQDGILALKLLDNSIDDAEKYAMIQKEIWKEIAYDGFANGGVISAVS